MAYDDILGSDPFTVPSYDPSSWGSAGSPVGYPQTTASSPSGGADDDYVRRLIQIESGGNPAAVTGSNRGLGQFSPDLEKKYGITDWKDPDQQISAIRAHAADNAAVFKDKFDRDPTPGELYLMHQQGAAGGPALIANPDQPAWRSIRPYYKSDRMAQEAIYGNIPKGNPLGDRQPDQISSGEFANIWTSRFPSQSGAPSTTGSITGPGAGLTDARTRPAAAPTQPTQRPYQPNFIDNLAHNPMFMAGLAVLGGPHQGWGPGAATAAAQTTHAGIAANEYANTAQQRAQRQAVWNQVFPNGQPNMQHPLLQGVPQEIAQAAAAGGADEGLPFLQKYQMASGEQKLALQKQFDMMRIQIAQGVASGKITQEEAQRFLSALPGGSTGAPPPTAPRTGNAAFFPQSQPQTASAGPPTAAPTAGAAPPVAGPGSTPQTPGQAPGTYDTGMSPQADQEVGLPPLSPRAQQILNDMRWADALGLHDRSRLYADQLKEEPSVIARQEAAKKLGQNIAALAERRRAGTNIMKTFQEFQDAVQQMRTENPDAFSDAIGPLNQSNYFQTARGATLGRLPFNSFRQGADYKNRMDHLIDGLTTAFMSAASSAGLQMSDSRMEKFTDTMGAMRKASTPQRFDTIMNDAQGILKNIFSLDNASLGRQAQQPKEQPPVGGAKKAPDGNWYVKDPQRPGKYLRVDQ